MTARSQQDAVADRGHRLLRLKEISDVTLKRRALEIVAHAARAMPARQQQRVKRGSIDGIPTQRLRIIGIGDHRRIGVAGVAVGPHQKPDQRQSPQQRNGAPEIEALSGQHHVVGGGGLTVRRRKGDGMARVRQHLPADGGFARIEVPRRQRDENAGHRVSHQQDGRARGLARGEIGMRLRSVLQRIGLV